MPRRRSIKEILASPIGNLLQFRHPNNGVLVELSRIFWIAVIGRNSFRAAHERVRAILCWAIFQRDRIRFLCILSGTETFTIDFRERRTSMTARQSGTEPH